MIAQLIMQGSFDIYDSERISSSGYEVILVSMELTLGISCY